MTTGSCARGCGRCSRASPTSRSSATPRIRDRGLRAKVLILTVHAEERYLLPVLRAGGAGYVQKSGADTDLLDAIRTVARGDAFLYPGATRLLLSEYLGR